MVYWILYWCLLDDTNYELKEASECVFVNFDLNFDLALEGSRSRPRKMEEAGWALYL